MEDRYIAAVDLGSAKISLTVARISGEDIQILYYRERPSDGIRNSAVFNPAKASLPIREAIDEAENELKIKILQVVVGLPRCDVRQQIAQASVERTNPDESISVDEVESLKSLAQNDYPLDDPEKEELYGAIAQSFSDDENIGLIESDIIGVISKTFEGNFKIFIGKKKSVETIDKVFNNLGVAIARKYFTPGAIAKAVLTNDEMENGVALVDFGGGATSVTIYQGKILRHYAAIPFGGKSVTNDIRTECSISESLAENIKLAFGACQPERLQNLGEKIIQIEDSEMDGYKQIPVKYLSEIISAREREIIDAVLYEIQMSGLADNLRSGVVITGGAAQMANLASFIKEISGYSVRTGYPRHLFSAEGCPGVYETSATSSLGMILAAKNDGLINCITAPAPEIKEDEFEAPKEEEPVKINVVEPIIKERENEPEPEKETVSASAEKDEVPTDLFGRPLEDKEAKRREKELEKERKRKEKEEKPSVIVTWKKKFGKFFGDLYDGVNKENV